MTHAVIEHVWSTPGQGGAFKFGLSVGALRMALTAAAIPFDPILPRVWQKALGVSYPKGSTDTVKKNITKRRAQQLFPTLTVTHAIADALLLAEYCRRLNRGLHGEEESLTRTEGTYKGTGGEQTIPIEGKLKACIIRPAEQGSRRARTAQGADPSPAGASGAAGNGKHGRRQKDGRHLPAHRRPARGD
jgi:hypothetical protein